MKKILSIIKSLWIGQSEQSMQEDFPGYRTAFRNRQAICECNLRRILLFAPLIVLLEFTNILIQTFTDYHAAFRVLYNEVCLLLALLCCAYFIVVNRFLKTAKTSEKPFRVKPARLIYLSFWGLFELVVLLFCLLEFRESAAFMNYVLLMTVLIAVPILYWKESLLFVGVGFAAECALMLPTDSSFIGHFQIMLTLALATILISYMLYLSFTNVNRLLLQLQALAETDPLTGLLNRRGFCKKAECLFAQSKRNGNRVIVSMLDVDIFKNLNDELGHAAGDECLVKIAEVIRRSFKRTTDVVSRFGGDEFQIFAIGLSEEEAVSKLNRILFKIQRLKLNAGTPTASPCITVSIGSVSVPADPHLELDELSRRADQELFRAKNSGRSILSFNGELYPL